MSGSSFGKLFKITTFGESHGNALGVVIDGCPAGLTISYEKLMEYIKRRKPQTKYSTGRVETDTPEILSGVYNNQTLGTPITIIVKNHLHDSKTYTRGVFRPGHADYTYHMKYQGVVDYRGGGRASGRETVSRVIAGFFANEILSSLFNIQFFTYTLSINNVSCERKRIVLNDIASNFLFMPDKIAYDKAVIMLDNLQGDSVGGVVECVVKNVPPGIGEPVFDKLDAALSHAVMSIGSVKGIEFGSGFALANMLGSEANDQLFYNDNCVCKTTNHSGGIVGGISDGSDIIFRAVVKPTPSISIKQSTINANNEPVTLKISGKHDKVIVPRAVVVIEAMTAITLVDYLLQQNAANIYI